MDYSTQKEQLTKELKEFLRKKIIEKLFSPNLYPDIIDNEQFLNTFESTINLIKDNNLQFTSSRDNIHQIFQKVRELNSRLTSLKTQIIKSVEEDNEIRSKTKEIRTLELDIPKLENHIQKNLEKNIQKVQTQILNNSTEALRERLASLKKTKEEKLDILKTKKKQLETLVKELPPKKQEKKDLVLENMLPQDLQYIENFDHLEKLIKETATIEQQKQEFSNRINTLAGYSLTQLIQKAEEVNDLYIKDKLSKLIQIQLADEIDRKKKEEALKKEQKEQIRKQIALEQKLLEKEKQLIEKILTDLHLQIPNAQTPLPENRETISPKVKVEALKKFNKNLTPFFLSTEFNNLCENLAQKMIKNLEAEVFAPYLKIHQDATALRAKDTKNSEVLFKDMVDRVTNTLNDKKFALQIKQELKQTHTLETLVKEMHSMFSDYICEKTESTLCTLRAFILHDTQKVLGTYILENFTAIDRIIWSKCANNMAEYIKIKKECINITGIFPDGCYIKANVDKYFNPDEIRITFFIENNKQISREDNLVTFQKKTAPLFNKLKEGNLTLEQLLSKQLNLLASLVELENNIQFKELQITLIFSATNLVLTAHQLEKLQKFLIKTLEKKALNQDSFEKLQELLSDVQKTEQMLDDTHFEELLGELKKITFQAEEKTSQTNVPTTSSSTALAASEDDTVPITSAIYTDYSLNLVGNNNNDDVAE